MNLLTIKNCTVSVQKKRVIRSLNLSIKKGELHVLMGPNGSGKSTLAQAIMGNPTLKVRATQLTFNNKDLKKLSTDKRAKAGIFLGFQNPIGIPGVSLNALFSALKIFDTTKDQSALKLSDELLYRDLNQDFSGGEKKKIELLQMLMLKPKLAILDEPDSGLDIDALKLMSTAIRRAQKQDTAILLITHHQRFLKYLRPDTVHVLINGTIVKTDGPRLIQQIENYGYEKF